MSAALNILLVLLVAPLLPGVVNRTKALVAGRKGPPLLQLYYDIAKLLRKGTVLSRTTTWVFLLGPAVSFAVALVAALMLPISGGSAPVAFAGDVIVFVYLFALARFFTTAAALDTGSAFEGMGAARELTFACLAEPTLFLGFLALARIARSFTLSSLLVGAGPAWKTASATLVLVVAAWFIVLLVENCRVPFDDPSTHLELTMIHEVMVLDHSGPALGLVLHAAAMKLFLFATLLGHLVRPHLTGNAWWWAAADAALGLAVTLAIGVAIGLVESGMARLKLLRVPQLLVTASLLAGFATVLVLR